MRFSSRRTQVTALPGVSGTARVARRAPQLLSRLREGDIAVIDHHDLDQETASRLVAKGVVGVINAAPMISPRYANLGPEVLAEAGIALVDHVGEGGWAAVPDNQTVRIDDGVVYVDDTAIAHGRVVELGVLRAEMERARSGLAVQLDTLTYNAGEFVRREQDLLLDGRGLPRLTTRLSRRAALVVVDAEHEQLASLRRYVAEQNPAIIAVGTAADGLIGFGWAADIVVGSASTPEALPSPDALRAAADVVLVCSHSGGAAEQEFLEGMVRMGLEPALVKSSATPEDLALLIADRYDVLPLVGVGLHTRLEDFLDRREAGLASTFATRLKVGSRLVDASAVPALHTSGATTAQVVGLLVAGILAVGVAVGVTPAGQDLIETISDRLGELL